MAYWSNPKFISSILVNGNKEGEFTQTTDQSYNVDTSASGASGTVVSALAGSGNVSDDTTTGGSQNNATLSTNHGITNSEVNNITLFGGYSIRPGTTKNDGYTVRIMESGNTIMSWSISTGGTPNNHQSSSSQFTPSELSGDITASIKTDWGGEVVKAAVFMGVQATDVIQPSTTVNGVTKQ